MHPPIKTARLILRCPTSGDFARFHAIHGDPATNRFNPAGPMTSRPLAQATFAAWREHWRLHGYGQWAVATVAAPDEVIGFGGIALRAYLDAERVNLGYRFDPAFWGLGYASEVAAAAREFGMATIGLPRLFALVRPQHLASIRVLEKTGMRRAGELDDVTDAPPSLIYDIDQKRFASLQAATAAAGRGARDKE